MQQNSGSTPETTEPSFSSGELGQLQEILFGQQQRTTHQQIQALQSHVDEQLQTLNNVVGSRLNKLTELIDDAVNEQQQQFEQLRAQHAAAQDIQQTQTSLLASVERSLTELQQQKVDSTKLAGLLTEMAGFLSASNTAGK